MQVNIQGRAILPRTHRTFLRIRTGVDGKATKCTNLPVRIEASISPKRTSDPTSYLDAIGVDKFQEHALAPIPPQPPSTGQRNSAQLPTPSEIKLSPSSGKDPVFSIDLPPVHLEREEYLQIADAPDAPQDVWARTQVPRSFADDRGVSITTLDQQEADAALDALELLLQSVFVAVGQALGQESGAEHIVTLTTDNEATMTAATQEKIHGALQKVIGLSCLQNVSLESLLQIMKLSEASLKQTDGLEIRADESWDEIAVESWMQRLCEVETALKAARTCARMLSGGRNDRQLYSESVINRCVNMLRIVADDIVIPLVELRNSASSANFFRMIQRHKTLITPIFICCQQLFAVLAELVTKIELSGSTINTLEFTASELIFVENAYSERDSAIGVQLFDDIRSVAMDMLCQIFLIKPDQRQGIIDDILTSLEKLPVGRQRSRQLKLPDGGSIQPVSALIMRLVQASSGRVDSSNGGAAVLHSIGGDGVDAGYDGLQTEKKAQAAATSLNEEQGAQHHAVAIEQLEAAAAPLSETASRNASYVINFVVKKAIGSTKTGDMPYRNLLDLFVEDFTICLDSPGWPSAELLLRFLMVMMVQLFEAPKTAAPAKNMALELLGTISAAISRVRSHVKTMASASEGSDAGGLCQYLSGLATQVLEQKRQMEHIVAWSGPFRATLEYLQRRSPEDPYLSSAISFMITDWASRIHSGYDSIQDDDSERDKELGRLAYRLRQMMNDRKWLFNQYTFNTVTRSQARLAFSIILLRSPLCESFSKILNVLLGSMASDQATVRSRSLKSLNHVLEADPSILDGDSTVIQLILDCSSDSSTQVRDSALGLLGNCIGMRPSLEPSLTPKIINRFRDAGVGVRKRAMKLGRDIYLRNQNTGLRSAIANGLLRRVQDPDEGVRDLARQMIEEIWLAPFYANESTAAFEMALTEHVALIVQTVKTGTVTDILDKVFRIIVRPSNGFLEGPFTVCSRLVDIMFGLVDHPDSEDTSVPSRCDALRVLTIFAKADPKLFKLEQIRLLKPHLASFTGRGELASFRAATAICKRVLPQLPTVHAGFLVELRLQLLKNIGKISSRRALDDLIDCTRTVCELLKDSSPLANLVASSLLRIQELGKAPLDSKHLNHLCAYATIVGSVGKHCDLDKQLHIFQARFPRWQGGSVPRLIVDTLLPFALPSQFSKVRQAAIEAIGLVCQSWPRNYIVAEVHTAFQQVFQDRVSILEATILRSFKQFLMTEERRSDAGLAVVAAEGNKKELTVMGGTGFDDVASATTQLFLEDITRIALGSQDEHAFLAVEVLGSIKRQGLTHPKDIGVTLITLETSANRQIAELAFVEHRSLHEKHETVLEREYVKAVLSAYNYQRDIVKDSHGATVDPSRSKLHLLMEVLKVSKPKNRQRFLQKLCNQTDFELSKLDATGELPPHVDFSRFVLENVAFFEYQTVGDIQIVVDTLEKIVTDKGVTVAQAIESEIFNVRMDVDEASNTRDSIAAEPIATMSAGDPAMAGPQADAKLTVSALPVEPQGLRQLTTASMVLLSSWETCVYLRRLYDMSTNRRGTKTKVLAEDLNKMPSMTQGVREDKFRDAITFYMKGLHNENTMVMTCRLLVELMNVGKDFKVAHEKHEPGTPGKEQDDKRPDKSRKRSASATPGRLEKRAQTSSRPRKRGRKHVMETSEDDVSDGDWIWT